MNNDIIQLTIDDKLVQVNAGSTILQAAVKLGISIPTMCYRDGCSPSTSCMVCVVGIEGSSSLIPSCGAKALEGMRIRTNTPEVLAARKTAVDLLLSEHAGDCEGPCRVGCPAGMDIPKMLREIAAGKMDQAIRTIKSDIALPAILGRICPAPCEKVCRRNQKDNAISICLQKRAAADWDLRLPEPYRPQCKPDWGKKVAIVGAGPCGLAAAYYLAQAGVKAVLFDKQDMPGGMLRSIEADKLPVDVLEQEINQILTLPNVEFRGGIEIGVTITWDELFGQYDAIFIASGQTTITGPGIEMSQKGLKFDHKTYQTSRQGVFAGGEAVGRRRLAVRAVADGKEAAVSILHYLSGAEMTGTTCHFNSRLGHLLEGEIDLFLVGVDAGPGCRPANSHIGFSDSEAVAEARRCLKCDCGKKNNCILRRLAEENHCHHQTYKGHRKAFTRQITPAGLVFEQGKCILCGLCVQTARRFEGQTGLAFSGRGFETQIAVPLDKALADSLTPDCARACADICPTGAISLTLS